MRSHSSWSLYGDIVSRSTYVEDKPTDIHWSSKGPSSKTPLGSVTPVNGMISIRDKAKGRGRTVLFTRTN
jgi:hypothetical protein